MYKEIKVYEGKVTGIKKLIDGDYVVTIENHYKIAFKLDDIKDFNIGTILNIQVVHIKEEGETYFTTSRHVEILKEK